MTCIVGLKARDGSVWFGGDSLGANYTGGCAQRSDAKVFSRGPYRFGYTSSFRMGQILRYDAILPPPPGGEADLLRFMVCEFVPAVREALKSGAWAKTENGKEEGGFFVVGLPGALFCVQSDYQVEVPADGYCAVGSGEEVALGALAATRSWRSPRRRVIEALKAAERHNAFVRGPFVVEQTGSLA